MDPVQIIIIPDFTGLDILKPSFEYREKPVMEFQWSSDREKWSSDREKQWLIFLWSSFVLYNIWGYGTIQIN